MQLLLRAIITGFGYKIGAELGRLFAEKVGIKKREDKAADSDLPEGLPKEPPNNRGGDEPAPPDDDDGDEAEDDGDADGPSVEPNAA